MNKIISRTCSNFFTLNISSTKFIQIPSRFSPGSLPLHVPAAIGVQQHRVLVPQNVGRRLRINNAHELHLAEEMSKYNLFGD